MIAAIIPARGGSKRVPRKNILPFAGRPLLEWSVAAAKASPSLGEVWVTTDDDEIAEVAYRSGAKVIARPADLAGDDTPTLDVILHALDALRAEGHAIEAVATLQPTNPLRPIDMIEDAIARFRSTPCDSLVSVSQRRLKTGVLENDYYVPSYPFGQQSRTTVPLTYENGLLYISAARTLDECRSLCGERILGYVTVPPFDDVDIDEPIDFAIGEIVANAVRDHLGY